MAQKQWELSVYDGDSNRKRTIDADTYNEAYFKAGVSNYPPSRIWSITPLNSQVSEMSEFRKLQAKLEKIDESYFSRLATAADEIALYNQRKPVDELVELIRTELGDQAAEYMSDKLAKGGRIEEDESIIEDDDSLLSDAEYEMVKRVMAQRGHEPHSLGFSNKGEILAKDDLAVGAPEYTIGYNGEILSLTFGPGYESCSDCGGKGRIWGDDGFEKSCPTCYAEGQLRTGKPAGEEINPPKQGWIDKFKSAFEGVEEDASQNFWDETAKKDEQLAILAVEEFDALGFKRHPNWPTGTVLLAHSDQREATRNKFKQEGWTKQYPTDKKDNWFAHPTKPIKAAIEYEAGVTYVSTMDHTIEEDENDARGKMCPVCIGQRREGYGNSCPNCNGEGYVDEAVVEVPSFH